MLGKQPSPKGNEKAERMYCISNPQEKLYARSLVQLITNLINRISRHAPLNCAFCVNLHVEVVSFISQKVRTCV